MRNYGNWVNSANIVKAHHDSLVYAASVSKLITAIATLKFLHLVIKKILASFCNA